MFSWPIFYYFIKIPPDLCIMTFRTLIILGFHLLTWLTSFSSERPATKSYFKRFLFRMRYLIYLFKRKRGLPFSKWIGRIEILVEVQANFKGGHCTAGSQKSSLTRCIVAAIVIKVNILTGLFLDSFFPFITLPTIDWGGKFYSRDFSLTFTDLSVGYDLVFGM